MKNEMGCLIMTDGDKRYTWEKQIATELLHLHVERQYAANGEDAAWKFSAMKQAGMNVVIMGIGEGIIGAMEIAARFPVDGLICIGSPFCRGWRRVSRFASERRALGRAFAVVCPVLIVHPARDQRYPVENALLLEKYLPCARYITILQGDSAMESMNFQPDSRINMAIRDFFCERRKETACVFR